MRQFVHTAPPSAPERTRPLAGIWFRTLGWGGEDIQVPPEQRGPEWRKRAWGPWKQVGPAWGIAKCCFNDLGPSWTDNTEWSFDAPASPPKS